MVNWIPTYIYILLLSTRILWIICLHIHIVFVLVFSQNYSILILVVKYNHLSRYIKKKTILIYSISKSLVFKLKQTIQCCLIYHIMIHSSLFNWTCLNHMHVIYLHTYYITTTPILIAVLSRRYIKHEYANNIQCTNIHPNVDAHHLIN